MKTKTMAALGGIAIALAACGGGNDLGTLPSVSGGGSTPTLSGIPASALQSVDAFVAYLRQLGPDETSEPSALPDAALPTSDTTEPA